MATVTLEPQVTVSASSRERAIHLEGGLFGPDLLERLEAGGLPGQKPADFGLAPGRSVLDEVAEAYRDARDLWQVFVRRLGRLPEDDPATTLTREGWVIPFLGLLGYKLCYNTTSYQVDGASYFISHRADDAEDSPPIHIAGAHRELGRVDPSGRPRMSPHALVQEFLNRSDHLWGLVTNGLVLRLLRQSTLLRRQSYVEFDLETIFEAEGDARFNDFVVLYRLLHRTRLPQSVSDAHRCLLEQYHQQALEQGSRARDRLRDGVEQCLKILGTGFLRASPNWNPDPAKLYEQLLRLIYRFLFLLVAEERHLLGGTELYHQHYSVSRLRRLVDRIEAYTGHDDLWQSLRILWFLLGDDRVVTQAGGQPLASLLGLSVLDGELFGKICLDSHTIRNRDLLTGFRSLVYYFDDESDTERRVNYAALDVEELGSVYESLLDNQPVIQQNPTGPDFSFSEGTERRTTGSYYTPPELVQELIRSALEPVIEQRLAQARTREAREQALLGIRVLDPACGSGHFLLAAARRLGKELARVRSGEEEPSPEQQRDATRTVIAHCIYGVDKNPLAVELCKLALWTESHVPGRPLTFLDHRIRCGDSLVGVLDLTVLSSGIPDEAFEPVSTDRQESANLLKKRNRSERRGLENGQMRIPFAPERIVDALGAQHHDLETIADDSTAAVREKKSRYDRLLADRERLRIAEACDLWTAAFFQRFTPELTTSPAAMTTDAVTDRLADRAHPQTLAAARALAEHHRFFHWPLEFPEVFASGGFDVVLSNPPWERIKLQEEEFFASRDPEIARAPTAAARKRLIVRLEETNPALWRAYQEALHDAETTSKFLRISGRFPLTGRGDINTYAVFAELVRRLLKPTGRAGIIVPTGIATDATTQHFFADLMERRQLASLYDFENRQGIFPSVHRSYKFCLLTLAGPERPAKAAEFAFFCHETRDLQDPERRFTLSPEDLRLVNPNTRTAPIFRSRRDAELTKHIYRRVPVLVEEGKGKAGNPWGVEFLAMFHMANDSHLFRTREELEAEGYQLEGNIFVKKAETQLDPTTRYLPLYEAKMIHQFDHRFGDYRDLPEGSKSTQLPEVPLERLADPDYVVLPRYWVPAEEVEARLAAKGWTRGWLLGWRDITNATNERTVIAAVIPRVGVGNKVPVIVARRPSRRHALLGSVVCSFPLDYAARQKVGGTTLNFFIFEQLPVLPPAVFERPCPWSPGETIADWLRPRVLELTYTAWVLKPFAEDLGYNGPPFRYDPERRFQLRCELDAAFFLLYLGTPEEWEKEATLELKALFATPRDAVAYILDQFPIVRRKDEERYGEYRTRRVILEMYDTMREAIRTGRPLPAGRFTRA